MLLILTTALQVAGRDPVSPTEAQSGNSLGARQPGRGGLDFELCPAGCSVWSAHRRGIGAGGRGEGGTQNPPLLSWAGV